MGKNEDAQMFVDTFNATLDRLLEEGHTPHEKFAMLNDYLEIMRQDPIPEPMLQAFCETMTENRILKIRIDELQSSLANPKIQINLN